MRMHAQREDAAVLVERERGLAEQVATMRGRQEFLDALRGPLDRSLQLARAVGRNDVFSIKRGLHAEPAADVAHQNAHLVGRNAEHLVAHFVANPGRRLAAHAERDAIGGGVIACECGARLDRRRDEPLIDEIERHHVRGRRHRQRGRFRVAVPVLASNVAGRRRPHERCARSHCIGEIDDHRQRLVHDFERFRRIAGLLARVRHDRRHGFADVAHDAHRQRMLRRRGGRGAVAPPEVGRLQQRLHAGADEIVAGHHGDDARHFRGRGHIDRGDPRMRIRRADEGEAGLAGQREIVGELVAAGQQAVVLDAPNGLAAAVAALGGLCVHDGLANELGIGATGPAPDLFTAIVTAGGRRVTTSRCR